MVYGQRIGPIISDSLELAKDIILRGFKLGANSLVLPINKSNISYFTKFMTLELLPTTEGTKMIFGAEIKSMQKYVIGFRSMAYG